MVVELGNDVILAVHNGIKTGKQITDLSLCNKLKEITLAHQIFKRLQKTPDIEKSIQKEQCSNKDKELIEKLILQNRKNQPDFFDYKLNIVLSNDAVFKSLTPKIQIRIKDQEVEMSVDEFSDLRYEIARGIHRIQHYLY